MNQKIKEFTDLDAWIEGHKLVLLIYKITKKYPKEELFSLVNQTQRAIVSYTSNIAEGFGRWSYAEKARFYYIAQGSLSEVKNQIIISKDLEYISNEEYDEIIEQISLTHKLIKGLISKTIEKKNEKFKSQISSL